MPTTLSSSLAAPYGISVAALAQKHGGAYLGGAWSFPPGGQAAFERDLAEVISEFRAARGIEASLTEKEKDACATR